MSFRPDRDKTMASRQRSVLAGCRHQEGLVLLLSLALLAGLSLLALLAAASMLQQRQMAANYADGELARFSAKAAVNAGENLILGLPDGYRVGNCMRDCFTEPAQSLFLDPATAPSQPEFLPDEWWLEWGQPMRTQPGADGIGSGAGTGWPLPGRNPPVFTLQELEFLPAGQPMAEGLPQIAGIGYYQVLGRGTGTGVASTHVAESIFARPWLAGTELQQETFPGCSQFRHQVDCGRMAYRERR
jgi:Tfp pilus assembly protein PilX